MPISGSFTTTPEGRYFEDYVVGAVHEFGSINYLSKVANLGSPGCDELRWTRPVFPGDELTIRVTVLEARRSESRLDRGIVHSFVEVLNQKRQVVMSLKAVNFVRCRAAPYDG
jgi:acyl dehydratase